MASNPASASFSGNNNSGVQATNITGPVQVVNYSEKAGVNERKCLQAFRLSAEGGSHSYEWYKNRNEDRVENTCKWFLEHKNYVSWCNTRGGPLLVSADPGCGKSVLAKYLIDHELKGTVIYFFFKEMDQNTLKQALCALLHQLFTQQHSLIKNALQPYAENGAKLIDNVDLLEDVFDKTLRDPEAGAITVVLDALDECLQADCKELIRILKKRVPQYHSNGDAIKILLTTRPYEGILAEFWQLVRDFPTIRIPGEEYSEQISAEINYVIEHRVNQVAQKYVLKEELKEYLQQRLLNMTHRTYLWLYLVFDHLDEGFKKTQKGIRSIIDTLPATVNEAYEKILQRSTDGPKAWRALSIVFAAKRPLSLKEMNEAVNLEDPSTLESHEDLDLESEKDFKITLRNWCGLFISIYDAQIYFLHQTAREFLRSEGEANAGKSHHWRGSVVAHHANAILGNICVAYLNFSEFKPRGKIPKRVDIINNSHQFALFKYAAKNWIYHYDLTRAQDRAAALNSLVLQLCKQIEIGVPIWLLALMDYGPGDYVPPFSPLTLACFLELDEIVSQLITAKDQTYFDSEGYSPLYYASGSIFCIQILLKAGLNINMANHSGSTALHQLAMDDNRDGVRNLLHCGAYIDAIDEDQDTPLHKAATQNNLHSARELLVRGANVNARDRLGNTALHIWLSWDDRYDNGIGDLLAQGADVHQQNLKGLTVLHVAAYYERTDGVNFLLNHGAGVDEKDFAGRTALHWAAAIGATGAARVLLDAGADINARRNDGATPLNRAIHWNNLVTAQLLLTQGALISMEEVQQYETSIGHNPQILRVLQEQFKNADQVDPKSHGQNSNESTRLGLRSSVTLYDEYPSKHYDDFLIEALSSL